jgi:hypothetical protein
VRKSKAYSYPLAFLYGLLLSRGDIDDAMNELSQLLEDTNREVRIWDSLSQGETSFVSIRKFCKILEVVLASNRIFVDEIIVDLKNEKAGTCPFIGSDSKNATFNRENLSSEAMKKNSDSIQMGASHSDGNGSPHFVRYTDSTLANNNLPSNTSANGNVSPQQFSQQQSNGTVNISPVVSTEFRFTERERKLQKLKEFRQMLYRLRSELFFLVGEFRRSLQDYNELLQLDAKIESTSLLSAMITFIGK